MLSRDKKERNCVKLLILLALFLISCSGVNITESNGMREGRENGNCSQERPIWYVVSREISNAPIGINLRGPQFKIKIKGKVVSIDRKKEYRVLEGEKYFSMNAFIVEVKAEEGIAFSLAGTSISIEEGAKFYILADTVADPDPVSLPVEIGKTYTFEYIYSLGPVMLRPEPSDLKIFEGDKLIFWGKTSHFFRGTNLLLEYDLEDEFFEKFDIKIEQIEREICESRSSQGTRKVFYLRFSCGGQEIKLKPGESSTINCFGGNYIFHLLTSQRITYVNCIDCSEPGISFYLTRR
ncbi:hypothetical protein HRbin19_00131 [bacterium HR19]|nr:hypothetical protein HRbin19_00131 [bacterium HR19]